MTDLDNWTWKKIGKRSLKNSRKKKRINIDVMCKLKCRLMSNSGKRRLNIIVNKWIRKWLGRLKIKAISIY